MHRPLFILRDDAVRKHCAHYIMTQAPEGYAVKIAEPTRSLEQNALLWKLLSIISENVIWHTRNLTPDDWKNIFSASLKRQDVVPNLDSTGFVILGQSTSKMTKAEFGDFLELIYSFGAEHGVKFDEVR